MPSRTMLKSSRQNSKRVKATFEVARRQGKLGNSRPINPSKLTLKRKDYDALLKTLREIIKNPTSEKLARAKKYYAEYLASIRERRKAGKLTIEEERKLESSKKWIEELIKKQYPKPKLP